MRAAGRASLVAALAAVAAGAALGAWAGRRRVAPPGPPPAVRLAAAERAFADGRPRAIRRLPTAAPRLFAFEVDGRIEREDIEAMAQLTLAAFDTHGEIDILILMTNLEGMAPGAVLDRLRVQAQLRSLRHVRRYAVVGPPAWIGAVIEAFDPLIPVEARVFDAEAAAEAWAWAAAPG